MSISNSSPHNESSWTLFPRPQSLQKDVTFKGIAQGSGKKVFFVDGNCFVRSDFKVEEDWWQLYPSCITNFTLSDDTIVTSDK
jgi:hypothetical protein